MPLPSNTLLLQAFPQREYSTDEIDVATITKTNRFVQFRNWDGNFWVAPRDNGTTCTEPPTAVGRDDSFAR